jgi:hypothetical protein
VKEARPPPPKTERTLCILSCKTEEQTNHSPRKYRVVAWEEEKEGFIDGRDDEGKLLFLRQ